MSRLQVFHEHDAASPVLSSEDGDVIASKLREIGVRFERWPTRLSGDDILAAYASEIEALKAEDGYQTVDVVRVTPDHPDRAVMRTKFLSEHTHAEAEVRFFVGGEGLFTLHHDGHVFDVLCTEGDLMSVPAGMKHWFDMGATPHFTAIRLFVNPDGWVAAFTGDDISDRFPRHEPA
jgi:1,2-dihydroxy-3-keto-5-methylthiopentene dioxygenase